MQLKNIGVDAAPRRHCMRVTRLLLVRPSSCRPCGNHTKNSVESEPKMPLIATTEFLDIMIPIAKAIPVLGTPVEGALEATSKILGYAQVRTSEDHHG
jgi:hypothetical protein